MLTEKGLSSYKVTNIMDESATKICTGCEEEKSLDDFHRRAASRHGRKSQCKICQCAATKRYSDENPEKVLEQAARWRRENPEKAARSHRNSLLKRLFGITLEEYEILFEAQNGTCKICKQPSSRALDVDHCHQTGLVRGLLCSECNLGLGKFRDNPEALRRAAKYVEDSRS